MSATLALVFQAVLATVEAVAIPQATTPTTLSAPAGVDAPQPLFASATRVDRIGRVMAPVMINGKGPYRLVIDTGASHSTFSPKLTEALGLTPSFDAQMMLNGVTGAASVPSITVDRIQAGDLLIEDAQVPVVYSSIMADADGILGVAGLRNERIIVDFRKDRIEITRSSTKVDTSSYLRIPAHKVAGGLLMVDARIGGVAVRAVIDTGAERTLGNGALRDAIRAKSRNRDARWANTEVYGATTQVATGESSVAPPIKLGPTVIRGTEIVFGDFHIFKLWELDKRPAALIGMDVLGTVQALVLDYRNRYVYVDLHDDRMTTSIARGEPLMPASRLPRR